MYNNVNKGKKQDLETYWIQLRDRLAELGIPEDINLHNSTNHELTDLEALGGGEILFLWLEAWGREGMRVRRWIVNRVMEEVIQDKAIAEDVRRAMGIIRLWSDGRMTMSAEKWIEEIAYIEQDEICEDVRDSHIRTAVIYVMMACNNIQCFETKRASKRLETAIETFLKTKEIEGNEVKNKAKEIIKKIIKKETVRNGIECGILPYLFHDYDPYMQWHHEGAEMEQYIKYGIPKSEAIGWFLMGVSPEEVVYSYINGRV